MRFTRPPPLLATPSAPYYTIRTNRPAPKIRLARCPSLSRSKCDCWLPVTCCAGHDPSVRKKANHPEASASGFSSVLASRGSRRTV